MFQHINLSAYRDHGFVTLPDLVRGTALDRLRQAAASLSGQARHRPVSAGDFVLESAAGGWLAWQRGEPALPGTLRSVSNAHLYEPDIERLADDLALAQRFVSPAAGRSEVTFVTSYYWAKPPVVGSAKPWHQDMAYAPSDFHRRFNNVTTIWIAVDRATADNGCLELARGSHLLGLVKHHGTAERGDAEPRNPAASEYEADAGAFGSERPLETVPLLAGSAVMFDGYLLHRSSANSSASPRRAISLVFAH